MKSYIKFIATVFFILSLFSPAYAGLWESESTSATAITGGTIDGTVIGGTTPAAGTFTDVTATGTASAATYGSDGTVSDAELLRINSLTSNAQDQIDGKAAKGANTDITSLEGAASIAPAAVTSFAGTISAETRTATFSSAADWALAKVGSTLIADGDTRIIVAIGASPTVTVDINTTWAGSTAITSLTEPISQTIQADGTVVGYVNALGGQGWLGGLSRNRGLVFSDGDTGLYEVVDDNLSFFHSNVRKWDITPNYFGSTSVGGGTFKQSGSSATSPFVIDAGDVDTGIGHAAVNQLSQIAGGVEAIRSIEANSIIYNVLNAVQQETITDGSTTAASAVISKAGENFDSTCAVGDTVLIWGGTTVADYGVYSVSEVTSATQLTLNSVLSVTNTDVDFYVFRGGLITTGSKAYVVDVEASGDGTFTGSVSVGATSGSATLTGTQLTAPAYGIRWDADADTYEKGVLVNGYFCISDYADFPIQAQMKRCLLSDAGVVNYYLEPDDSYNRLDVAPSITGTDDTGTANKVSDSGVFTADEADLLGKYVHNTTDDTYAVITAKDSADVLSISADIMDSAETFEICTATIGYGGSDGQVMVEIPAFHYLQYQHDDYRYFMIAAGPFTVILPDGTTTDSAIHPAFYKGGSATPSDYRYVGAYEGSMYDASTTAMVASADIITSLYAAGDKLCSYSGQYPKVTETIVEFRPMAEERGTGWHQFDYALNAALQALYLTEYADFDSQTKIGAGRTALTGGTWVADSYIGQCGKSNADGNATGNTGGDTNDAYMSYRGIENWYGNVYKWIDGCNINNDGTSSKLYLCTNYINYASNTASNYILTGNLGEEDGYSIDFLNIIGVWPVSVGGDSSTYLCDYYYTDFDASPSGGWRVVRVGGRATDVGASAGAFCVNASYASSDAFTYVGGRLCF